LIDPLVPAGTTAEFEVISPALSFKVEAFGCGLPVSQAVSQRIIVPLGMTAMFSEYARELLGTGQAALEAIGMIRVSPAEKNGLPNGALPARVSTIRHGVIETSTAGTPEEALAGFTTAISRGTRPCMAAGLLRDCQYNGAGQLLTGSGEEGVTCARTDTMVESVTRVAK
jgi:hypothetical protein